MRPTPDLALLQALAAELKARRFELGIPQEELAHRAGLSRTFIGRIEISTTQPSLTALFALARALEVSPEVLIAGVAARHRKELRIATRKAQR
mgnify:CR=1 FL=1